MLEMVRFDLRNGDDLALFTETSAAYYAEVCTAEECAEEIADLHDARLTRQLIAQTLCEDTPYFIMKIMADDAFAGFAAYTVDPIRGRGFINNFYVAKEYRGRGLGREACAMVEKHMSDSGAAYIALEPVEAAEAFWCSLGYGAASSGLWEKRLAAA